MRARSLLRLICTGLLITAMGAATVRAYAPEPAQHVSSYNWGSAEHRSGGFSGLELGPDGRAFTVISDRGDILTGMLERVRGRISDVSISGKTRLSDAKGHPVKRGLSDAEGLALRPDGRLFVSFEGVHRVWAYVTLKAAAWLPRSKAIKSLQGNSGLEALAIDAHNRLYAIPERSGKLTRPFPVWRYDGKSWREAFTISRSEGFLPVGADFGPDGHFYVLEREFSGLAFRSRVRRFELKADQIVAQDTLFQSAYLEHGNLEGLAVWRDAEGAIRLTMISDNNFKSFQRTEFVEYRVAQ
jgi:hypothetical protein